MIDFTYPGTLNLSAGSNMATALQNINNVLGGNYEYYYDINGVFHFQEIKNYLNTSYVPLTKINNDNYTVNFSESSKTVYDFKNSDLIISYTNTPNYSNIKNDIYVWGAKENENGTPILYHIAIDTIPEIKSHEVVIYEKNKKKFLKPYIEGMKINENIETVDLKYIPSDWRCELYIEGLENEVLGLQNHIYWNELKTYFPDLYDFDPAVNAYYDYVTEKPSEVSYWLDFISSGSNTGQFSIENIGRRVKAVTDTKLHCIYNDPVPDIVIINEKDMYEDTSENGITVAKAKENFLTLINDYKMSGQKYVIINEYLYKLFEKGNNTTTCYDKAKELINKYTYYNEAVSINALPLYFLEPNQRIKIENKQTGIQGDFMIQTINLPLASTGQMTLTASKATTKI